MLTDAQLDAVYTRGAELAVAAGAGSGKTSVLIERVITRVLGRKRDGSYDDASAVDIDRLLVVTFTKAAAAELRERLDRALANELARLSAELAEGRLDSQLTARMKRLRRQRILLPQAQISTIHSFCQRVIERFGADYGVQAGRVLDEEEAVQLKHELAVEFLDERLGQEGHPARALAQAWMKNDGLGPESLQGMEVDFGLRKLLLKVLEFQSTLASPGQWWEEKQPPPHSVDAPDPGHPAIAMLYADIAQWRSSMLAATDADHRLLAAEAPDSKHLELLEKRRERLLGVDTQSGWDGLRSAFTRLLPRQANGRLEPVKNFRGYKGDPELKEELSTSSDVFKKDTEKWQTVFALPWRETALRENAVLEWLGLLWKLAREFAHEYSEHKRGLGVADFNDLERYALHILAGSPEPRLAADGSLAMASEASHILQGEFDEVLVDEYQDVNRLQDILLSAVVPPPRDEDSGRARFVVGDIKQSIYGFRLAEPELFSALVDRLDEGQRDKPSASRLVRMRENWRSRPEVLASINQLMEPLMTRELGGEDYASDGALRYAGVYDGIAGDEAGADLARARLTLLAADVSDDAANDEHGVTADSDEDGGGDEGEISAGKAELLSHHLCELLAGIYSEGQEPGGYIVDQETRQRRPLRWGDCVVMLRGLKHASLMRSFLDQAGIPVHAQASGSLFEQREVLDVMALLQVLDNPYDDIALAAVLRGPAGRFDADTLLAIARGIPVPGRGQPALWQRLQAFMAGETEPQTPYTSDELAHLRSQLGGVMAQLERWQSLARELPAGELLWQLLTDTGLPQLAAGSQGSAQRLANLHSLFDKACMFDRAGRGGLSRMLAYLRGVEAAMRRSKEGPGQAEGMNAVRIISIHRSKGLQFPVVILPYLNAQFNMQNLRERVLCDYHAGLQGQYFDLTGGMHGSGGEQEVPTRTATLGYQLAQRRIKQRMLSEELRMLYVAITRARERLELLAVMPDKWREKGVPETAPEGAKCPLDWVTSALHEAVATVAESPSLPQTAQHDYWQVRALKAESGEQRNYERRRELAGERQQAGGTELPERLDGWQRQLLKDRLAARYPLDAAVRLPLKVSVSELKRWQQEEDTETGELSAQRTARRDTRLVQPSFMRGVAPGDAAQTGTRVHKLLALTDVTRQLSAQEVQALWAKLGEPELAAEYAPKVAGMLGQLAAAFPELASAQAARELPVSLAISPAELPWLEADEAARLEKAGDWVLGQGVIDLLLLWPGRAVVLDYKTDRNADASELRRRYHPQLEWYVKAAYALWPQYSPGQVSWALYALNGEGLIMED